VENFTDALLTGITASEDGHWCSGLGGVTSNWSVLCYLTIHGAFHAFDGSTATYVCFEISFYSIWRYSMRFWFLILFVSNYTFFLAFF